MLNCEKALLALNDVNEEYLESARLRLGYKTDAPVEKRAAKRVITLALTAALLLGLGAAAYAAGVHAGFFKTAFGTGIAEHAAETVEITAPDGSHLKEERFPASERADMDEERAQALIGDYVSAVGQSVQLGNYTARVRDLTVDENGIGALTVDVDNPNGHGFAPDGSRAAPTGGEYFGFSLSSSGGTPFAARDHAAEEGYSETHISLVYAFASPAQLAPNEDIILRFTLTSDGSTSEERITLPAKQRIAAHEFRAEGMTAYLSPVGAKLIFGTSTHDALYEEYIIGELILSFADGSRYAVKSEGVNNSMLGTYDMDNIACFKFVFNRLVDVDALESIYVRVTHCDSQCTLEESFTLS